MRASLILALVLIGALSLPLVGISPSALVSDGHAEVARTIRAALAETKRTQIGEIGDTLGALLDVSPRSVDFSWNDIERHGRHAAEGYEMLRRVTDNDFVRSLSTAPGDQLGRLAERVAGSLPELSLDNARRSLNEPLPGVHKDWF